MALMPDSPIAGSRNVRCGTDRVGHKTAMGAASQGRRGWRSGPVPGLRPRLAAARGKPIVGRDELRPTAELTDCITELEPIVLGQRMIVASVSPTRDAGGLRDDQCVDVRVALVVAPRPDMAQGAWQDQVRVGADLCRRGRRR